MLGERSVGRRRVASCVARLHRFLSRQMPITLLLRALFAV